MPTPLSEAEIDSLVKEAVKEANATSMQDMGNVMAILKPKVQGRADVGKVSQLVKANLA